MNFLRRLNGEKGARISEPPKIRLDLSTWIPPILLFLANLFLILPLIQKFPQTQMLDNLVVVAYILGPTFLYFYVWEITNRRLVSLLAGLIYTMPLFRLSSAVIYDDAAHIMVLNLFPLVLIFFLRFLRQQTLGLAVISAIGVALVSIISPFGIFTLLIFMAIETYSEMLLGQGRVKLFCLLLVLVIAAGLSAFCYHPAYIVKVFSNDKGFSFVSLIWSLVPISFFLVPTAGAFSFLIFDRRPNLQSLFLSGSSFITFLLFVFVGDRISTDLVPVPSRFLPELSISFSFLTALLLVWFAELLRGELLSRFFRLSPILASGLNRGLAIFYLLALLILMVVLRSNFWQLAQKGIYSMTTKSYLIGDGVSQIIGLSITILTILTLGVIRVRTRTYKP